MRNAKSFAIAILVFFLFFLLVAVLERLIKVFLGTLCHSLPRKRVTKIELILLDTLIKVSGKIVPLVVFRDTCGKWHATCFFREKSNGGSKRADTVTDIPHLR